MRPWPSIVATLVLVACKGHIPAERLEAQQKLVEAMCKTCLAETNACGTRACMSRARKAFGESPKGWGNTAEADAWRTNEQLVDKCRTDADESYGRWWQAETRKRDANQPYDRRLDTGCTD